jgi:4,5-DOPA dioxygenase extradiol
VGTQVSALERPEMIYDFTGFPRPLYEVRYPAPGSPELAALVRETVKGARVTHDMGWGLDHGAWSVLCRLFPGADVPVVELSLDRRKTPQEHYALACELRPLRRRGVLILGSGNMVHNLGAMVWRDSAFDWADVFDERIAALIAAGDHGALVDYPALGPEVHLAVPTGEHYLPLLYTLAQQEPGEPVTFFTPQVTLGSVSMRSLRIG